MSYEVGAGHISIFPQMKGFKKAVSKEVEGAGNAGKTSFAKAFNGKELGTRFGIGFKKAAAQANKSDDDLLGQLKNKASAATRAARTAMLDYKTATINAQQTQEKLNGAVEKYGADSAQAQKASIAYEKAELRKAAALEKANAAAQKAKDAQAVLKAAQDELGKSSTSIGQKLANVANNFKKGFDTVGQSSNSLTTLSASLGSLARALLGVDTIWKPLGAKLSAMATNTLSIISGWATQLGAKIQNGLQGAIQKAQAALSSISSKVAAWLSPLGNAISSILAKISAPFASIGSAIGAKIKNITSAVATNVTGLLQPAATKISSFFAPIARTASSYMGNIKTAADKVWNALPEGVRNSIGTIGSYLGNLASKTGTAFKNIGTATLSGLKGLATGAVATLSAGALAIGGTVLATGKQALAAYATWEQAVGGVDTLFKDASGTVQQYAANAYKTAGISANEYMNQVTSFSASLISSLGGNTARAAEMGNMAITDMSDNANKMGTSMDSIQQTYQSLARGNYAMLDNLKLGYGGTKSEMQRLIDDANKLRKANGQAGDLTIDKFSDVVQAIHEVQTNMGITGTTAREAATTIEGSVDSMKAAWENWLAGLGQDNADMTQLSRQLTESIATALKNIIPRVGAIAKGVVAAIPGMFQGVVSQLPQPFQDAIGRIQAILGNVSKVFSPLKNATGPLAAAFAALGSTGLSSLLTNLPVVGKLFTGLVGPLKFLSGPIGIIIALVTQLVATTPSLQASLGSMVSGVLATLMQAMMQLAPSLQQIMAAISQLINAVMPILQAMLVALIPLIQPLISMLTSKLVPIIQTIMSTVTQVITTIAGLLQESMPVITTLINGVAQVILALMPIIQAILGVVGVVITGIAGFITSVALPIINFLASIVQQNIGTITAVIQSIVGIITGVFNLINAIIHGNWQAAWDAFKNILTNAINAAGGILRGIKDIVLGVFSGAGSWLLDSGKKIVQGLIDGIKNMAGAAGNAIKGVMDKIAGFLPHSPAKEGPFSGHGWTPYSGRAMVTGLAQGITTATPQAVNAIRTTMNGIHNQLTNTPNALAVNGVGGVAGQAYAGINLTQNISVPDPLAAGRAGVQMLNMAIA